MYIPAFVSFFLILIILYLPKEWVINQDTQSGIQNFHKHEVARIGGGPVFIGFFTGLYFLDQQTELLLALLLISLPVFIAGFYEDLSAKVTPLTRLVSAFFSIIIAFVLLDVRIDSLGFGMVDYALSNYILASLLFTLLVVGGAVNSLNIIDGFNGLLGGYSILASLAVAYISYVLSDDLMFFLSLILTASVLGFFVLNFPFGKIFIGDGGAYFIGIMLAVISLLLVDRHAELSSWFVLLIFMYPMYELLYSIYRRKILHKVDASQPDANHLHSLVYKKLISCDKFSHNKIVCNSMVAPIMWALSLVGIIPAIIWHDDQGKLIISAFVFMLVYTVIYKYISSDRFKFNRE